MSVGDVPSSGHASSQAAALGAGGHLDPADGMCVMEAVSVAAGLPWTDAPASTNPTLALLARHVNDAVSDSGREMLVQLIPGLMAAHHRGLETDWAVVQAVGRFTNDRRGAARTRTMSRWMSVARVVHAPPLRRPMQWMVRNGAARRAIEASVAAGFTRSQSQPDEFLLGLLTSALTSVRAHEPSHVPQRSHKGG